MESIEELRQKLGKAEGGKTEIVKVETNIFDKEEIYPDCTVQVLTNTATVDAVEVVHGIWFVDDYDSGDPGYYSAYIEVHCSKCGYELGAESGQYGWAYGDPFPLNYCPNCGAKMDGDGNG